MKIKRTIVLAIAILCIASGFMALFLNNKGDETKAAGGNTFEPNATVYIVNGIELNRIEKDNADYSRLDPEGAYTLYKDSKGLIYYTEQNTLFRVITNSNPQDTSHSDKDEMIDYLFTVTGMDTDRADVSGSWSENSYSKEYTLVQHTEYGEILLADVYFDVNDIFVSGIFNPDGYYNGTDSILPQDEMIELALGYVKDVFGEEYYDALMGRYKIDIIPVYAFKGELRCNILFENTDEDPFYAGGIWSNGCEIIINAITGEFRQSGY